MYKQKNILLLIILFILFIFLLSINIFPNIFLDSKTEYYDAKAKNIKKIEDCADIASSIYGVSAFSYNPVNKNCYISKTHLSYPILEDFPYHKFSSNNDILCNKRLPIINQKDIANNTIINNRIYECEHNKKYSNNKNAKTIYYFQKNKPMKEITLHLDHILPITYHNVFYIDWPILSSELNDLNVEFGQRNTKRNNFGEFVVNGDADNLFISWNPVK